MIAPLAPGWSSTVGPAPQAPTVQPSLSAPSSSCSHSWWACSAHPCAPDRPCRPSVRGDDLADAKARQAQIKKDMAAQQAMVAKLTALQGDLAQEIKNTAGVLKGINADLAAVKVKITTMEGQIDVIRSDYDDLVDQAPGARCRPGRHRGPGGRQEGRPRRPQAAPRRSPAERLRLRPDVAPRDVPVGQHVHRPARRDEQLHRRRRTGQGARQRDRAGPGDARRHPPGDRGHPRPDQRPAPGRRRPRSGRSTRACASSTTARPPSSSSSSGPRPRSPPRSGPTPRSPATRPPPRRRWPSPLPPRRSSRTRSQPSSESRCRAATSRPPTTAR